MSNTNNDKNEFIEINGKRYDAVSGALLNSVEQPATAKKVAPSIVQTGSRLPAKHLDPHHPETSKLLMRKAVKKPSPQPHLKAQGPLAAAQAPPSLVQQRLEQRQHHAAQVAKNHRVRHFVAPKNEHHVTVHRPSVRAAAVPTKPVTQFSDIAPVVHRGAPVGQPRQTTEELLERALREATSHEQKPHKHAKSRSDFKKRAGMLATAALAITLLATVAVQNISSAQLQMASAKAGFDAKLPTYAPAGFRLFHLKSNSGEVDAVYHSNSDSQRTYTITMKNSSWDKATLVENYVQAIDPAYQSTDASGLTIYLYGNGSATWVNNGVWYVVDQSLGALNDHQLAQLASSL